MAVVHAFALFAVVRSCVEGAAGASGPGACLTLLLSQLFFLLKTADVSALRFRPGKRTWIAACLLIAWIHVDTVDPSLGQIVSGDSTDLLATTVFIGSFGGVSQVVRQVMSRCVRFAKAHVPLLKFGRPVRVDEFRPRSWVLASYSFSLRAPPV